MGIFIFNPIFGRTTVPMRVRVSMTLVLTLIMLTHITGGTDIIGYIPTSTLGFAGTLIFEALIGFLFGFIVNLILTVIIYAGKVMDQQMTLALAESMDPSIGASMAISANLFYYMFILYFFVVGGHLNYIYLFALSYQLVPIGATIDPAWHLIPYVIAMYLGTVLTLAVKMAMPIIAAQLILQIAVGIIMKAVPTIKLLTVNIQMKLMMGFFILMAIAGPMSDFLQRLMDIMFESLYGVLYRLG